MLLHYFKTKPCDVQLPYVEKYLFRFLFVSYFSHPFSMIRLLIILSVLCCCADAVAQSTIVWQRNYGGSKFDQTFGSELTQDGGLISGGHGLSSDGDLDTNRGDYDWWVIKLDSMGNIIWSRTYGGSAYDKCRYAMENPDKTIMAFGSVQSNDGDVTGAYGNNDYWLLKLDSMGNIIWKKNYGGTGDEGGRSVIRTLDGNYIIAGYSYSSNYDAVGNHGLYDVLLIKVSDVDGSVIWSHCYGGSNDERVRSIIQLANGDFVFTGNTESTDGDLAGTINNGGEDVWTARIDSLGNLIWSTQYGSIGKDRTYYVTQDVDGHILLAGKDSLNGGNVADNHGMSDAWILKLNQYSGAIIWQKSFGGSNDDEGFRIDPTPDGGYTIGASSESNDGDCVSQKKFSDYWLFKVDSSLKIEWQRKYGGGSWDHLNEIIRMPDYSYACIGFSASKPSGTSDITNNHGSYDMWIVRATYCDPKPHLNFPSPFIIYPGDTLTVKSNYYERATYLWNTGATTESITVTEPGLYFVTITNTTAGCSSVSDTLIVTPSSVCNVPSNIRVTDITNTAAQINWTTFTNAIGYQVKYRVMGSSAWTTKTITTNTGYKLLTNLALGTKYQYRVRTKCQLNPLQYSAWSSTKTFTTGGIRVYSGPVQLTVNPNPAKDYISIDFAFESKKAFLKIFDAQGKLAKYEKLVSVNGYYNQTIDISALNKGFYIVEVSSEDEVYKSKLIVW